MKLRNRSFKSALLLASACLLTVQAYSADSAPVTGLGAEGAIEPNYTLSFGGSSIDAFRVNDADKPSSWLDDSATEGKWIGSDPEAPTAAVGEYTFSMSFDLVNATAISGKWASDNFSTVFLKKDGLSLGDFSTPTPNKESFMDLYDFSFSSLEAGAYTLDFVVKNVAGKGHNPVGLLVSQITVVPEPATLVSSILGLGLFGYVGYRRRKSAAAQ